MAHIKDLAVGDGYVYLTEGDAKVKFYARAHNYEPGLNGRGRTLFCRESPASSGKWGTYTSHGNTTNSVRWTDGACYDYLNSTYYKKFNSETKKFIGQTKCYCYVGGYEGRGHVASISCSILALSATECYGGHSDASEILSSKAKSRLSSIISDFGSYVWSRTVSPKATAEDNNEYMQAGIAISASGLVDNYSNISNTSYGYLPCFTLPEDLYVTSDGSACVNTAPTTPGSISVPSTIRGGTTITISWGASTDAESNLSGYTLECSTDGGSTWAQVYDGPLLKTTHAVVFGTKSVTYRVRAYDSEGLTSNWKTGSKVTVVNNTAPTTPGSITVPSTIHGGTTISISWEASTDAESNLSGYKLECSTDGGSTWTQIYQGSAVKATYAVTFGTATVTYRVKAYDSGGLESGWKTSAKVTVINNTVPTAPASITVPAEVKGGSSCTIKWGAATDAEGNLSGYILERSVGGAAYAQVYKGTALTYTDSITKGWASVAYRVKAYDSYNAQSGYTTSATRTVINNTAPTVTSTSTALGKKNAAFAWAYTVSDVDGDKLTVTEKLDSSTTKTRTNIASGTALTFEQTNTAAGFQCILNGSHTLQVTVSDGKLTTSHSATFTKAVTKATITLAKPMTVDSAITVAALSVTGSIPADAAYKVEATNNALDTSPVWQDVTAEVKAGINFIFANTTTAKGAAFNFRVSVSRGSSGKGGYIEAISGAFQ